MKKKILLTGGHAGSTAFVTMMEIRREKKDWDLIWVGFGSSMEGEKISSLSSMFFPKYGIKTYSIVSGRLQRNFTIHTLLSLAKIPVGFIHSLALLCKIRPNLILSFGGFSAFPVVVVGSLLRIPVLIHEQTSAIGRANKHSSFFAKRIAISRETSRKYFSNNKRKVVFTGNPTPREVFQSKPLVSLSKGSQIFITGGQSGSIALNEAVKGALPRLLKDFKVVHLTGIKDKKRFRELKERLNTNLKKNYTIFDIVDPNKYNQFFSASSIIISRAGANTVSKIIASQKPSILIPLPISYLTEQEKNAQFAQEFGVVRVINQSELSSNSLLTEVNYLLKNYQKIAFSTKHKKSPDKGAASRLVSMIEEEL